MILSPILWPVIQAMGVDELAFNWLKTSNDVIQIGDSQKHHCLQGFIEANNCLRNQPLYDKSSTKIKSYYMYSYHKAIYKLNN